VSDRSEILDLFASFDIVERLNRDAYSFSKPILPRPVRGTCRCGRFDAKPGRKSCETCIRRATVWNAGVGRDRHRARVNARKARLRAAAALLSVCTTCLKADARPDRTNCVGCAAKQAERYRSSHQ
jgi:Transferrin